MKLRNTLYSAITLFTMTTALVAMDTPILSVEQYQHLLTMNDCPAIVLATKNLWPDDANGIHINWTGTDLQVVGQQKLLPDGTSLNDAPYRAALRDYLLKNVLHPAMYGTMDIAQAFARIDLLSNSCNGVFGVDPRGFTQIQIKWAILTARFSNNPIEQTRQAARFNITEVYNRDSINNLITYVGRHAGEGSFFGGKLPFKVKLSDNKRILGLVGVAAALCIGYVLYTNYYATKKKDIDDEDEHTDIDQTVEDAKSAEEKLG